MKKTIMLKMAFLIISFQLAFLGLSAQNQVKPAQANKPAASALLKKVSVNVPGTLGTLLTANEKKTLISLALTGTIDLRDFEVMNKQMPALTTIDLGETKVAAYDYSGENELPRYAFYDKSKLKKVTLPPDLTTIGSLGFYGCTSLKELSFRCQLQK